MALSSAEVEFWGMAKGICELLWLKRLLTDRIKHVEVDHHFIKQDIDKRVIHFPFAKSKDQLADILTNPICSKSIYN